MTRHHLERQLTTKVALRGRQAYVRNLAIYLCREANVNPHAREFVLMLGNGGQRNNIEALRDWILSHSEDMFDEFGPDDWSNELNKHFKRKEMNRLGIL